MHLDGLRLYFPQSACCPWILHVNAFIGSQVRISYVEPVTVMIFVHRLKEQHLHFNIQMLPLIDIFLGLRTHSCCLCRVQWVHRPFVNLLMMWSGCFQEKGNGGATGYQRHFSPGWWGGCCWHSVAWVWRVLKYLVKGKEQTFWTDRKQQENSITAGRELINKESRWSTTSIHLL